MAIGLQLLAAVLAVITSALGLVSVAQVVSPGLAFAALVVITLGATLAFRHVRDRIARLTGAFADLSSRDQLTGALNREAFDDTFGAWVGNGMRRHLESSLLLVDVDQFDRINREHGHEVGDAALRHLSGIIQSCIRETDAFGRLDGEEFGLLFPATSGDEAVTAAERIRSEVARRSGECGAPFTISIGVTGGHAFSDPWAAAARALSLAKSAGCNRVVLAETETQAVSESELDLPGLMRPAPYEQTAAA